MNCACSFTRNNANNSCLNNFNTGIGCSRNNTILVNVNNYIKDCPNYKTLSMFFYKRVSNASFLKYIPYSTYSNYVLKVNFSTKMARPKVYMTRSDCPQIAVDMLREKCEVEIWKKDSPIPREELLKNIKGKDGIFCLLTDKIDKEVIDSAGPSLKVVGTMSVGYDHIDFDELKRRNIKLGYTPDVLTDAVAELTVALLLATSRRLFESHQEILNGGWGSWSPLWMCGPGLKDSTVGIVGFGRIGQEVGRRLKAFNIAKLVYNSRSQKPEGDALGANWVDLDQLLTDSDFVIVTCGLTPHTMAMFNDDLFAKMKPNAVFINTSRGGVVNQASLQRALENKTILAAGLDVVTPEPLPVDHPLLKLRNCVILPHIGSATIQTRRDMAVLTAKNIICALEGQPLPAQVE